MSKRHYDEVSVVRVLNRKSSITIKQNKTINVVKNATDIGNSSWGKIDYLCKVHDYIVVFVENNNKQKSKLNDEDVINSKIAKREAKINIVSIAKNAMKNVKYK